MLQPLLALLQGRLPAGQASALPGLQFGGADLPLPLCQLPFPAAELRSGADRTLSLHDPPPGHEGADQIPAVMIAPQQDARQPGQMPRFMAALTCRSLGS